MMFVFKRATPRAHAADTIQTLSLVKWRISMLFWTRWYYGKRDKQWSRAKIFNQMTVGIRYVQKKYGGRTSRSPKAWLGLPELRQLLDFEAMTNRCVELSEEHQVRKTPAAIAAFSLPITYPSRSAGLCSATAKACHCRE